MLLVRDALADLFPIHRDWLAHLAVLVLHAAWHGIGAWHRDTFPTIQFPEATDLVFRVSRPRTTTQLPPHGRETGRKGQPRPERPRGRTELGANEHRPRPLPSGKPDA